MTSGATWFDRDVRVGAGSVLLLPEVVREIQASRVLLVTGRGSFEASGAARLLEPLVQVSRVERWSDFTPNPAATELWNGLQIVREFRPDLVVGVGGGTAMDMAKLLVAYAGVASAEELRAGIRSGRPTADEPTELVLIPTTSGSGSEATRFAVVYIGREKFSVADPRLLPRTVLLDHTLTLSSTPYQRATSGIDAVAQAMESLWSAGATETSRHFAGRGLQLTLSSLPSFVRGEGESPVRGMAWGAHLAGRAIDLSRTTAAHALSYGFTTRHGVSHGHAVGLTLGPLLEAHVSAPDEVLQSAVTRAAHHEAMQTILSVLDAVDGAAARRALADLMADIGLDPLSRVAEGPEEDELARLASMVNVQRLGNNPVLLDDDDLRTILHAAWADEPLAWRGSRLVTG